VVLKAVSEQGKRLYVRKATLREWSEGFARHLRAVGVEANATPRQVRSESAPRKSDGIYRVSGLIVFAPRASASQLSKS
jgi:hypothetical protein